MRSYLLLPDLRREHQLQHRIRLVQSPQLLGYKVRVPTAQSPSLRAPTTEPLELLEGKLPWCLTDMVHAREHGRHLVPILETQSLVLDVPLGDLIVLGRLQAVRETDTASLVAFGAWVFQLGHLVLFDLV